MYAKSLLESWLRSNCSFIHGARIGAVVKVVGGLLTVSKATLTDLGRNLGSSTYEKHGIKCVDRLVGNRHFHGEGMSLYRMIGRWLLSGTARLWIIVDWSDVKIGHHDLMQKAAVPVGGGAVTLYEEVHPLKRYNNPKTHRKFLERLYTVVPASCCPIVITDAGYRGPPDSRRWKGSTGMELALCAMK